MKNKPYKVSFKEEGRGKASVSHFATLADASAYVQARWQGVDYMDGNANFHTDYATYSLCGFTLLDIGAVVYFEGHRDGFTFTDFAKQAELEAQAKVEAANHAFDAAPFRSDRASELYRSDPRDFQGD